MAPVRRPSESPSAAVLNAVTSARFAPPAISSTVLLGTSAAESVLTTSITAAAAAGDSVSNLTSPKLSATDVSSLPEYLSRKQTSNCPVEAVNPSPTADPSTAHYVCKCFQPIRGELRGERQQFSWPSKRSSAHVPANSGLRTSSYSRMHVTPMELPNLRPRSSLLHSITKQSSSARRPPQQPPRRGCRRANATTRVMRVGETEQVRGRLRSDVRKWHSPAHAPNKTNSVSRHKTKLYLGRRHRALQQGSSSRHLPGPPSMRESFSKNPHQVLRRQLSASDVSPHDRATSSRLPRSRSCCHCSEDAGSSGSNSTSQRVPSHSSQVSDKSIQRDIRPSVSDHSKLGRNSSQGSTNSLFSIPHSQSRSTSSTEHLSHLLSAQDSKEAFILELAMPKIRRTQKPLRRARARINKALALPAKNAQTTGALDTAGAVGVAEAPESGPKPNTDTSDDERRAAADGRIPRRNKPRSPAEPENLLEVKGSEEVESWLERLGRAHDCHDSSKSSAATDEECQAYARLLSPQRPSGSTDAHVKTYPCAWQSDAPNGGRRRHGHGAHKDGGGCRRWCRSALAPHHWVRALLARSRVRGKNAGTHVQRLRDRYTSHTLKTCMDTLARVLKQPSERAEDTQKCQQIALVSGPPDDEDCLYVGVQTPNAQSRKNAGDNGASDGGDVKLTRASFLSSQISTPESEKHTGVPAINPSDRLEKILKPMVSIPGDPLKTEKTNIEVMMTSNGGGDSYLKSFSNCEIINALFPVKCNASVTKDPVHDIQIAQKTESIQQQSIKQNNNKNTRSANGNIKQRKSSLINVEKNHTTIPEKKKYTTKQPLTKYVAETHRRQHMTKYTITSHPLPDLSQCRPKVDTGLRRPQNVSINGSRKNFVTKSEKKNSMDKFSIIDKNISQSKLDLKNNRDSISFPVYRFEKAKNLSSPPSSDHALPTEDILKSCVVSQRDSSLFPRNPLPQILEASDNEDGSEGKVIMCLKAGTEIYMEEDQYDACTSSLQSSENFSASGSENSIIGRQAEDHSSGGEITAGDKRIEIKEINEEPTELLKSINIRIPLMLDDPPESVTSDDDASVMDSTKNSIANPCTEVREATPHNN